MNELTTTNGNAIDAQFRDINTITVEIKTLYQSALESELSYAVRLGAKLTEAKELVEHGQWGNWIKENLPFSQDKAGMMMKIYENYGANQNSLFGEINSDTYRNLGIYQAFTLLQVPEEEREEFVKENHVEDMSVRELKKAIAERDAEKDRADAMKVRASALEKDNEMLRANNTELKKAAQDAKADKAVLDSLKNANELLKKQASEAKQFADEAEKRRQEAGAKLDKAIEEKTKAEAELKLALDNAVIPPEKLAELQAEADKKALAAYTGQKEADEAAHRAEIAKLEKKLAQAANEDLTTFKVIFEAMQDAQNRVVGALKKIRNTDETLAAKLAFACKTQAEKFSEACDGKI